MRKGYNLVEMIVVLALLVIAGTILAGAFWTTARDIPRSYQVICANSTVLNLIRQIEKDVEGGRSLPASFGEFQQGNNILLIESGGQVICYEKCGDEEISRRVYDDDGGVGEEGNVMKWAAYGARVSWDVLEEAGLRQGVAVRSHIEHKVLGSVERKMKGAHLFFVGAAMETSK